jgi:hypothetical protein
MVTSLMFSVILTPQALSGEWVIIAKQGQHGETLVPNPPLTNLAVVTLLERDGRPGPIAAAIHHLLVNQSAGESNDHCIVVPGTCSDRSVEPYSKTNRSEVRISLSEG